MIEGGFFGDGMKWIGKSDEYCNNGFDSMYVCALAMEGRKGYLTKR